MNGQSFDGREEEEVPSVEVPRYADTAFWGLRYGVVVSAFWCISC